MQDRAVPRRQLLELARHQAMIELQDDVEPVALPEPRLDFIVDEVAIPVAHPREVLALPVEHGIGVTIHHALPRERRVGGSEGNARQQKTTEQNPDKRFHFLPPAGIGIGNVCQAQPSHVGRSQRYRTA